MTGPFSCQGKPVIDRLLSPTTCTVQQHLFMRTPKTASQDLHHDLLSLDVAGLSQQYHTDAWPAWPACACSSVVTIAYMSQATPMLVVPRHLCIMWFSLLVQVVRQVLQLTLCSSSCSRASFQVLAACKALASAKPSMQLPKTH